MRPSRDPFDKGVGINITENRFCSDGPCRTYKEKFSNIWFLLIMQELERSYIKSSDFRKGRNKIN